VLFGTTVAAVSLALGIITYLTPPASLPPSRRAWPFLLAASLLILIAGFGSHLTLTHAVMLAALGGAVLAVWRGAAAEEDNVPVAQLLSDLAGPHEADDSPPPQQPPVRPRAESKLRLLQWALAAGLAAAAAKAVIDGATSVDGSSRLLRAAILAAGVISPLLLLPALATGTDLAQRGRSGEACGGLVGLALLNLCALLPLVIVLWYVQSAIPGGGGLRGFAHRLVREGEPLPLALSIWRIDVVVLVVVGFALLPAALGRWFIGRLESAGLILGYAAYLAATAAINVRL
jgi:Ca2+/Na+ antiporter